jgi:integrase
MANRKDNKGHKLKKGERLREDGRYGYRYLDLNGNRREIYEKSLTELRIREKQIEDEQEFEMSISPDLRNKTLNDLFDVYVEMRKLADTTYENYKRMWDSIVRNELGNELVYNIKPSTIKMFYSRLSKKNYAKATIKYIHELIMPTFEVAVDDELLDKNPAKRVKFSMYGRDAKERQALTVKQQEDLLEFVENSPVYNVYGPMLRIQLGTGLRAGELLGLTRHDFVLCKGEINIDHQLIYKNSGKGTQFKISPPKTKAGNRKIPMTEDVKSAIREQLENNLRLGINNSYEIEGYRGFLFNSKSGRPMQLSAYNNVLKNIVKKYNLIETNKAKLERREPELLPAISSHILRHTGCTRMAESGMNIKILQYIMGHENVEVTLQVYTHISDWNNVSDEMGRIELAMKAVNE